MPVDSPRRTSSASRPAGDVARAGELLNAYRAEADALLAQVLDRRSRALRSLPPAAEESFALLTEYVLRGGKRIRGALVLLGYEACGGTDRSMALDVSLSFELLHAYLLAFDDIMDRDETRRGGPALHVAAAERARLKGRADPRHEGESVTLLLGMLAQNLALDRVLAAPVADDVKVRALAWTMEVLDGVVVGQLLDVQVGDGDDVEAELAAVRRLKTGLYTMEGPLVLGALLAGAGLEDPRVEALRRYSVPLGEAFQIADDVLGAVGDPARTGKPAADLARGRITAVLAQALGLASGKQAERLRALVGRPLSTAEVAEAAALVRETGAIDAALARARAMVEEALSVLAGAGLPAHVVARLIDLAVLVADREA